MTDFSFTNKAYDLLINLREDNIIKDEIKPFKFNSIKEIRLMVDVIKTTYPLYANADSKTIIDFIKDIFNIKPLEWQVSKANHEEPIYRPIEIWEIDPGVKCKLQGKSCDLFGKEIIYYYNYTFPTRHLNPKEYNYYFMKIWKNPNPLIENKFKLKIGDEIFHKDDPTAIGTIKERLPGGKFLPLSKPYDFEGNAYSVIWQNKGINKNVPLSYWYNEDKLIKQKKLEAMPMKTLNEEIVIYNRRKGKPHVKTWSSFNQELYELDKKEFGYTSDKEAEEAHAGWRDYKVIYTGSNRKSKDKRNNLKSKAKKYRKQNHLNNLATYKPRPERYIERIPDGSLKAILIDERNRDANAQRKTDRNVKKYLKGKFKPNPSVIAKPKVNYCNKITYHKLVCVKHMPTGVVARVRENLAKELINKNDSNYDYVSKLEWRKYLAKKAKNTKDLNPPKYTTIGGTEGVGNSPIIENIVRKNRRANVKLRRHSRLVKEQFVPVIIKEETIDYKGLEPTTHYYDENGNFLVSDYFRTKFVRPAHIKLKRILTNIQPRKVERVIITPEVLENRKERSMIDKALRYTTNGLKSLTELKEEFKSEERRNEKYSTIEKWTNTFEELIVLILQGKLFKNGEFKAYVNNKSITKIAEVVLNENNVKWPLEKVSDFVRYIRLTTHGVFGEKVKVERPTGKRPIITNKHGIEIGGGKPYKKVNKYKKPVQSVEFEPTKMVTRIDYSKLKQNLPDDKTLVNIKFNDANGEIEKVALFKEGDMYTVTGEFLCATGDVTSWKYPKDKEYQDMIIDEGGGIEEVGIKFRRKDPEHLKIYFSRQKAKKLKK